MRRVFEGVDALEDFSVLLLPPEVRRGGFTTEVAHSVLHTLHFHAATPPRRHAVTRSLEWVSLTSSVRPHHGQGSTC